MPPPLPASLPVCLALPRPAASPPRPLQWLSAALSRVMLVSLEVALEMSGALADSAPHVQWLW